MVAIGGFEMSGDSFTDEISLAEQAETLGKEALKRGLISSFVVHHFPDSWEFYIPNEKESASRSPEEAYLYLKRLVQQSG